jgi:hypothetical protein
VPEWGQLGNGKNLYTSGTGIFTFDPATGANAVIITGVSGQYINRLIPPPVRLRTRVWRWWRGCAAAGAERDVEFVI